MAAYAALVSLMNNVEQIQSHTRLPISLDKKQMESLHEKVSFFIDFLESHSNRDCKELKDLEIRITDVAYAAEDIIETHVVDRINSHSKGETEKTPTLFCLPCLEKVMEGLDFIKEEVMKIKDKGEIEDPQPLSLITSHSSSSNHFGKNTMVGFDDKLIELMERLTGHESSRQIIPIVGMGGMGKTTLAKTAYDKPLIVHYFDFRVWVSISQEYSLRKILVRLLGNESTEMSEQKLGERLYKSLCGRRYLVVLDDMWSVEAWEMLKVFFPDYKNGSRVVVTTRISSLATYFGWCNLEMNFLDEDKGWDLLCEKVFAQGGCPLELEEVGRKIVKNCQGLPLSIVVIGGLLAKSVRRKEYWESIARDTKALLSLGGGEQCMKILSLSYHNLPVHLKPCFLYMGVLPEDEEICASFLIKLWVAEGFLKRNSSKELEVVAEEYLTDLISRNIILVHRRGLSGKIKSCMIHDLLRDLSLKEAQNKRFLHVPKMHSHDKVHCISSQRRISFHRSSSNEEYIPQVLENLKQGSLARSLICDVHEVLPLQNFRLLRVLKVSDKDFADANYSLDDIFQVVNSRLIAISTIVRPVFPPSISLLWNLQILIVIGIEKWPIAPLEIWEMTELRHLHCSSGIYLPDPPSQQMNRQGGDGIMKNLQALKRIVDFRCRNEVVKRIPNIKKLEISYSGEVFNECCLQNLGLLKKLESLTCLFHKGRELMRSDVLSHLAFPGSLKQLTLSGCGLHWEDMTMIGSLPHLQVLILKFRAFSGPQWVTVEGEFRCLKYLKINDFSDLVHWKSESSHFPRLGHLVLRSLDKLVEIPSGIGDIPTLQSIELEFCSNSAIISAKKILEEQEGLGNEDLQIRVLDYKSTGLLESLASNNFVVQTLHHTKKDALN